MSKIPNLKTFHNWVKGQLITQYLTQHQVIVDMCCGKGGDLHKLSFLYPQSLLGIDVSTSHLIEARERFNTMKNKHHFGKAEFVLGDLRQTDTYAALIRGIL